MFTFDRSLHVLNALALLLAAGYFVFRLEAATLLLAEKLNTIDQRLIAHEETYAHDGAREDLKTLGVIVSKLATVSENHQSEIDRMRNGK